MEKLQKALELRKAKYTKRTGSPGHYKYEYGEKKGKKKGPDIPDVVGAVTGLSREQRQTMDKKFGNKYEIIKTTPFALIETPNGDRFRIERSGKWSKTVSSGKSDPRDKGAAFNKQQKKKKEAAKPKEKKIDINNAESVYQGYLDSEAGKLRWKQLGELDLDEIDDVEFIVDGMLEWLQQDKGFSEDEVDDEDLMDELFEMVDAGIR